MDVMVAFVCILRRIFEKDGGKVVCDSVSFEFLKGAKIEFEDSLMRSAFVVSAPACACMACMSLIMRGSMWLN